MKKNFSLSRSGFTLLEVLVASAILALVALIVVGLADSTARMTNLSQKRMSADGEARQALDRMSTDLRQAILREDLSEFIGKQAGNDEIIFHAQTDGYGGNRGISKIAYDGDGQQLRRGATGTTWENTGAQLAFQSGAPPEVNEADYDIAASDVFRFELAFLMADGRIRAQVDRLSPTATTADEDKVQAVIVGLAALDKKSREQLDSSVINSLPGVFGEAQDNQELLESWKNALEGSNLPEPAKNSIRLYQRFLYLDPA